MTRCCARFLALGVCALLVGGGIDVRGAEATGETQVRTKLGYPVNLIYGLGQMNMIPWPEEERDQLPAFLQSMGLRTARRSLSWFFTERERGTYDWTSADERFLPENQAGFTVVALITDTPLWASHPKAREILANEGRERFVGCLNNEPETWPDYERWLTAAVERYGPYLDYYELRNEPDGMCGLFPKYWEGNVGGVGMGGDPEWYAELMKRTSRILRQLDPTAKLALGGMEDKRGLQTDFIEGVYQRGCGPYFDAVAIHPYGEPFGMPFDRQWLATVRGVMARYGDGDKPMWFTEYNNEGHNELDMSFTVRRNHRLIREATWATIAIPLGTHYMFYGKEAANWPLRAIRQMEASEFEPRREWRQDFEGHMLNLLANWEWRAQPMDDAAWPDLSVRQEVGRDYSAGLWIDGNPAGKRLRVCFLPYVRSADPQFELWFSFHPKQKGSTVYIQAGAETLDILEPERSTDILASSSAEHVFQPFRFRIADHWPGWREKGLNMVWAEFSSPEPGFSLAVDDVWVH